MDPIARYGVHSVDNLMPSTWLAHPNLSVPLRPVARALTALDRRVAAIPPFYDLANNLIVVLRRRT